MRMHIPKACALAAVAAAFPFALASSAADVGVGSSENLWEISKNHLKDPFRWPSVWRTTPESGDAAGALGITGRPSEAAAPMGDSHAAKAKPDWRASEEKRTRLYLQKVGPLQPQPLRPMDDEAAAASLRQMGQPKHYMTQATALSTPFITETSGGRVFARETALKYAASNESEILQLFEEVTLGMGSNAGVKVGDLFRTFEVGDYYHSYTSGRPLGKLVETNGVVEVTRVGKKTSVARLVKCYGTISRDSRAAPLDPFKEVAATGYAPLSDGKLSGQVVWVTQQQQLSQPYSFAVIDQGARKGLKLGDMVLLFNRANGKMTEKVLGDGLVVNVQEESCTILLQDLYPGIVNRGDYAVAVQTPVL
jgi:hypothetical protein